MIFERSILIAAQPTDLFALAQDYKRRLAWDPFLRSATLLGGATTATVGVRALCIAHSGLAMETVYVSFNPPRACAVKMIRGPRFVDTFASSWRFEESGAGQTLVRVRCQLQARPRWLSWLLTPLITWVLARDTAKRLAGLKLAVEQKGLLITSKSQFPTHD